MRTGRCAGARCVCVRARVLGEEVRVFMHAGAQVTGWGWVDVKQVDDWEWVGGAGDWDGGSYWQEQVRCRRCTMRAAVPAHA